MPEPGIGRQDYDGGFDFSGGTGAAANPANVSAAVATAASAPSSGGGDGGITDLLSKEDFYAQNNITLTNPYGNQGIMTRMFGFDPSSIDYSNNLDEKTRAGLMALAYDRYANPYAKTNIFGDEVGGNKETGAVRYGLSSMMTDNMTQFGPVVQVPLPKSPARLKMESFPSIIGMLSKMAPGQTVGMIDSQNLPDGIPSASMGMQKYEESKKQAPPSFGQFLQGIFNPALK